MSEIASRTPYAIDVAHPHHWAVNGGRLIGSVDMYTEIFRVASRLPEVLQLVYDTSLADEDLRVLSAGCSVGAEADSVLALHNTHGPAGRIALTGIDINPTALSYARAAKHYFPDMSLLEREGVEITEVKAELEKFGFVVSTEKTEIDEKLEDILGDDHYGVDASGVRRGHNVSFIEGDLVDGQIPELDDFTPNLVLANNLLYHLSPTGASQAINRLAGLLAKNGILSIGDHQSKRYHLLMGRHFPRDDMSFGEWLFGTEFVLKRDHQLEVVLRSIKEPAMPVAFKKN